MPSQCGICVTHVSRASDEAVNCSRCDTIHHKSCVMNKYGGVSMDLANWICQPCIASPTSGLSKAINLMKNEIKRINSLSADTAKSVSNIMDQLNLVSQLSSNVELNTKRIVHIESSLISTNRLCSNLDNFDKSKRLVISGFPYKNDENVVEIIKTVAAALKVELLPQAIDNCFRFRARNEAVVKPILLILTSGMVRDQLLSSFRARKRKIAGNELGLDTGIVVTLGEHLSPAQHSLLTSAKAKLLQTGVVKFVWFAHNKILAKKKEGTKVITIRNEDDIFRISNSIT